MLYKRRIYPLLEAELNTKEITVITGMRRVGKTTVLRHLFDLVGSKNKVILDLENPLYRKVFEEKNYDAVWNNLKAFGLTDTEKAYVFIDEAQNLPELSRVVKYLYDHGDVKFFLTGSSSYYLRNLFPESLAGRKMIFELFPLDFSEFLVFKNIQHPIGKTFADKAKNKNKIAYEKLSSFYSEFVEFGGFPSVVLEANYDRKKALLTEIFTSYFEKDAKNLADFKDMAKLRDLILLLTARVGSKLDIAKLANALSVSRETVYNYLTFLEQTYFISLLPKHSGSVDRQAAGSKKLFFCDSGIANSLGKMTEGQLFEQSVYQNLRGKHNLAYYSQKGTNEVDFVVDSKVAIEAKISFSKQDVTRLKRNGNKISLKENFVVSQRFADSQDAIMATDL